MSRNDEAQDDREADDAAANSSAGDASTGAAGAAMPRHKLWLDIGKTVIAGVITAGVLQFIRGGRR